jgi:hypothetical protein
MGPRSAKESKYGALEHLVIIAFVTNSLVIGPCPHGRLPSSISDNHRLCFRTSVPCCVARNPRRASASRLWQWAGCCQGFLLRNPSRASTARPPDSMHDGTTHLLHPG